MELTKPARLIVGITGATGTIFGVRLLQMLHGSGVETHLVLSKWAARTLVHETPHTVKEVQALATQSYGVTDQGAAISSGSFVTLGMVIAPCSMRTLAANRSRTRRQPDTPGGRRYSERTSKVGIGGTRIAVQSDTSRKHVEAFAHGCCDSSSSAGFL